ncbi:MAG: hypothetical protein SGJ04_10445, partial [Bacteroidota bacterium]|nr:hypothetical protein [Bacteroidota bacterium]
WICKDLELQDSFGYVRFKYPYKDELRQDKSGLFSTLTDLKNGIPALVNIPVTAIYARQIVSDGVVPLHVYFIENDAPISQLVLKYKDGKYRVYSVKLR